MRTVKSCGSDVAVLALRPREAKLLGDNGGKRAVLREEHEVSRKAIAQGRPGCSRCTCMLVCTFCYAQTAHETSGAASTRSSLRPLNRAKEMQTSGASRRENAEPYPQRGEVYRRHGYDLTRKPPGPNLLAAPVTSA